MNFKKILKHWKIVTFLIISIVVSDALPNNWIWPLLLFSNLYFSLKSTSNTEKGFAIKGCKISETAMYFVMIKGILA